MDALWGYLQPEGAMPLIAHTVQRTMLALVLDLDETLLVAYSQSQLQRQIRSLENKL